MLLLVKLQDKEKVVAQQRRIFPYDAKRKCE